MAPRLIGRNGEFDLASEAVTIGRDSSNTIHVKDDHVSGFHCRIELEGDHFVVIDCDSRNGTFVNGRNIQVATLAEGDEVRIGDTEFRFVDSDCNHPLPPPSRINIEEPEDSGIAETVELDPADSHFLRFADGGVRQELSRVAQDMSVLLKLGAEINEAEESEALQDLVLERVFEIIPADNGAIVMMSGKDELVLSSAVVRRRFPDRGRMAVSKTITGMVVETGRSVLRNQLFEDVNAADSLKQAAVRSVLCVPLNVRGTRLGVMYLNTTFSQREFDQRHLELATAIAGIASLALGQLRYVEWLEAENEQLKHQVDIRHDMIGQSARIKKVLEDLASVAPGGGRVLILGESGTGKELAARAIHDNSDRRLKPFVAVNCPAITESLFASELFGHVRGAFSGADRDRKGLLEEAHGGTLFLDEIGDLSLQLQSTLLRVIEEGEVLRVGASKPTPIDIRLLSATNKSLKSEAEAGRFRLDLYFRLGLPVEMPPLRERLDDIQLLVRFFLDKYRSRTQRELGATPPETIRALQEYHWPGNIRELSGAIESAVIFGKSNRIRPEDLPKYIVAGTSDEAAKPARKLDDAKTAYERQMILRALEEKGGVVSDAADQLGRVSTYLQRRITKLGLRDELKRIRDGA